MKKDTIRLETEKMTNKIKEYIANHKELQQEKVSIQDLNNCAEECGCHHYYVLQVLTFGKITRYETMENGKLKVYKF